MLLHHIHLFFQKHQPPKTIWVGLSGGADSVALLHALCHYRDTFSGSPNVAAIHIHHGLNANANHWLHFCTTLCQKYNVPLTVQHVQVQNNGEGVEAAARAARYHAFEQIIGTGNLALAHHANDQVETLLLGVLRGGGLRALSAMPAQRFSGSLNIIRPFLHVSRDEIMQYIQSHQLNHIHDTSNDCTDFLRNWVRHDLLPHMRQRIPHIQQHILGSIDVLQDELSIINNVLEDDWQICHCDETLSRSALLHLSRARLKAVLLKFCEEKQLGTPRKNSLNDFIAHLSTSQQYTWSLPNGAIWLYREKLWHWHNNNQKQYLKDAQPFSGCLKHAPQLNWLPKNCGFSSSDLMRDAIVRPHRPHDRIHTPIGSKTVVKLLQDKHIPPALRAHWLVVEMAGKCVAVPNIAVCESVASENGYLPQWQLTLPFVKKHQRRD